MHVLKMLTSMAVQFLVFATIVCTTSSQQVLQQNYGTKTSSRSAASGCRDGTTEAFQDDRHPKVSGCQGPWTGHIENSSSLCSYGWKVCGWDSVALLRRIRWEEATRVPGCYAMNAAQDGAKCRPCIDDVLQDDLAGVGAGCAYKSFGTESCITGGQIDVSCCEDTVFRKACQYQPGLTTGIICCRMPGVSPRIVVPPKRQTHAMVAGIFVLSCRASGLPEPRIQWLHNGILISDRPMIPPRVSTFDSGYLIVSDAQPSDGGRYQCLATNQAGIATATAQVLVTEFPSGCADGTTDGLYGHEDIHACKGRWEGHVKRGRDLCGAGWQVCSPRHVHLLRLLTWSESVETEGCYAYNAANSLNLCSPCYDSEMAGVGRHCGQIRSSQSSCLAEGRIDVYGDRSSLKKCNYTKGITTGVLCCKRPDRWQQASLWSPPKCDQRCRNGGVCVEEGRCQCAQGYKGNACQTPICPGGCIPNSTCVKPRLCRCNHGYSGPNCSNRDADERCRHPCLNGGRCSAKNGRCKCPPNFHGPRCQVSGSKKSKESTVNRTKPTT